MRVTLVLLVVSVGAASVGGGGPQPPRDGKEKDYYAKVEVKGDLSVVPDYKFDPEAMIGGARQSGAFVYGGRIALNWELVIRDKGHYDFVKANGGKKVVASGDLVIIPPQPPQPGLGSQPTQSVRYIIRVTDIRLAEQK
jgi:hypothetical protein